MSTRQADVERFRRLLEEATKGVASPYFLLPIAGVVDSWPEEEVYRERVYAYELYHQLRKRWPWSGGPAKWPYYLCGEIDKSGQPRFKGIQGLEGVKPDLLVHEPGTMDHNLVAVEIKVFCSKDSKAFIGDFKKLSLCCQPESIGGAGYQLGVLLVYGSDVGRAVTDGIAARDKGIDLSCVELWHHSSHGKSAVKVDLESS